MACKLSVSSRNALGDALITAMGNGCLIKLYTGTRPTNPDTALSGNTLLGTLTAASPPAPATSSGVITFSAITQDSSADATGTATFYRLFKADATTAVIDGDVGTSGSDLNLNTTAIVIGGPILITSFTYTMPGG